MGEADWFFTKVGSDSSCCDLYSPHMRAHYNVGIVIFTLMAVFSAAMVLITDTWWWEILLLGSYGYYVFAAVFLRRGRRRRSGVGSPTATKV